MFVEMFYRVNQFAKALFAWPLTPDEISLVRDVLSQPEMDLFMRLSVSERKHSLGVYQNLVAEGERNPALLKAALLHDVGKSLFPLGLPERVGIVLGKRLFPERSKRWGKKDGRGLTKMFVVAERHPVWGAKMAENAGASPLVVQLIRKHHQRLPVGVDASDEVRLLQKLQRADQRN